MSGLTQLFASCLQLVGWLVTQPIASMGSFPAPLLAIAPVWYFRFGFRIPQVLFHTPKFERQTIVLTLLVMELCLHSYRTNMYCITSFVSFVIGLFSTVCAFVVSLALITEQRRLTNGCLDTLLVIDAIKSFLFVCHSTFSFPSLMIFALSATRFALFLGQEAWYKGVTVYQALKQSPEVAAGVRSLRKSPFYVTPTEDIDGLGEEFNSQRLYNKFNHVWSQLVNDEAALRYRLFWATLSTLRWDFALVCVARTCLGVATLAEARSLSHLLTVIENENSTFIPRLFAFAIITLVFVCYALIRQMTTHLMNRFVTFIRGILLGQIQSKTLRLNATNAHDEARTTLMSIDMDELINRTPDLLEIVASAIELGAGLADLNSYLGVVSFIAVIPILCTIIPSSKLSDQLGRNQKIWSNTIQRRVSETGKILAQTKTIKMIGIDSTIARYLERLFKVEMDALKKSRHTQSIYMLIVTAMDKFTAVLVLSCAILWPRYKNNLVASTLFPSLLLLSIITERLIMISRTQQRYTYIMNTYDRIQNYLTMKEFNNATTDKQLIHVAISHCMFNDSPVSMTPELFRRVKKKLPNDDPLQMLNVSVTLPGALTPLFTKVSISVPKEKLTVVVGINGSGKSKFLQLLLGEVSMTSGELYRQPDTTIAYCGQTSWLQNKSIKDSIVGGYFFSQERYLDVISRCRLLEDLEILPDGDNTIVSTGAGSLTLQYKMALARTAYSTASLILVDDVLSGLDATTANEIFTALFSPHGLFSSQRRTVVLATCFKKHVADAELAVFLVGNGLVITREAGALFSLPDRLHSMILQLSDSRKANATKCGQNAANQLKRIAPTGEDVAVPEALREDPAERETALSVLVRIIPLRLVISFFLHMVITTVLSRVPDMFASFWLISNPESRFHLLCFIAISSISIASNAVAFTNFFQHFTPECLTIIYDAVINTNLNAKLSYLNAIDQDRIVNQLNQHITSTSKGFSLVFSQITYFVLVILAEITIVGFMSGLITPLLLCVLVLIYFVQRVHIPRCGQLQHLKQQSEASFLTHHTNAATGIEYVRVSGQVEVTALQGLTLLNKSQPPFYHILDTKRWINCILDFASSSIVAIIAGVAVCLGTVDATMVGLAIFLVISIGYKIDLAVTFLTSFTTMLPSLVYLLEFIANTPTEASELAPIEAPTWPTVGSVELRDITATHGENMTDRTALGGLSLSIKPGQKVGLIDSNRSGRSLLMFAILNFLHYTGSIKIGNVEIMTIPRQQLRSRITTLTSDWLHLPGTIEQNLMPWRLVERNEGHLNRETVKEVLVDANLWSYIQESGGLSAPIQETEFSEEQRVQFCMARLIFHHIRHRNRVVVMDDLLTTLNAAAREKIAHLVSKYFGESTVVTLCRDVESMGKVDAVHWLQDRHIYNSEGREP